jgi:hypothetical protein
MISTKKIERRTPTRNGMVAITDQQMGHWLGDVTIDQGDHKREERGPFVWGTVVWVTEGP